MLEEGTDAVVLIVLRSSLANKLKGDGMWGVEVIVTTENMIALLSSS